MRAQTIAEFGRLRTHHTPFSRQIATFFLGWVCFYSLLSVLRSPLLAGLLARLGGGTNGRSFLPDPEGQVHNEKVVHNRSQPQGLTPVASGASERHTRESPALAFTLFLSFLLASFALFVSVFTFDSSSGGTLCGEPSLKLLLRRSMLTQTQPFSTLGAS